MKKYQVSVSTNIRSYESEELVTGEIEAENPEDAIENFWLAVGDAATDNGKYLDFDGNKVYTVDIEDDEREREYYIKDSAEAVEKE